MRTRRDRSQRGSVPPEVNQGLAPCSEEVVGVVQGFCLLAFQCANRVCLRADHYQGGRQAVVLNFHVCTASNGID